MRQVFINTLVNLAEKDDRIYLLTADMGFGLVEPFAEKYPDRFLNIGVAEQNMIGIATGLALSGKTVFCYSIANFPTLRCLEQIRNDVCYHKVNVNIVAGGTGIVYGALGSTHHATDDISIMRSLPNMTIVTPADTIEASSATQAIAKLNSPCYLRLGKNDESTFLPSEFKIGRATTLREGRDITIVSSGWMLHVAIQVAEMLTPSIQCRVVNMHTIKPLDIGVILRAARETSTIITIEEHSVIGGLGSAVAEVLADNSVVANFKRIGIKDTFCVKVGDYEALLKDNGLTASDIAREVWNAFW